MSAVDELYNSRLYGEPDADSSTEEDSSVGEAVAAAEPAEAPEKTVQMKEVEQIHLLTDTYGVPSAVIGKNLTDGFTLEQMLELSQKEPENTVLHWWQKSNTEEVFDKLEWAEKKIDGIKTSVVVNKAMNYLNILRYDDHFKSVKFNTLRGVPEKCIKGKTSLWLDEDDATARTYIEDIYKISSRPKYEDAFSQFQHEREYDPVTEKLDSLEWDGVPRVQDFLVKWAECDNTPYTRECSRLLFAGGINRAYEPGCKFDCVIVLIGKQGSGKSTLCQWLSMSPSLYSSVKTISGQKGLESIQGKWICEIEELLATLANEHSGEKAEENAKAFLSTASDFYRKPYEHRPADYARHCIFIGTTNRDTFLTDRTGNRRWYPVTVNSDGHYMHDHAAECKEDILQCWAEMRDAYKAGEALAQPVANAGMADAILEQQQCAEQEDWRIGLIDEYCKDKYKVCLIEIWQNALHAGDAPHYPEMKRKDSNEIAEIMVHKLGWYRDSKTHRFKDYGPQRCYIKPRIEAPELKEIDS